MLRTQLLRVSRALAVALVAACSDGGSDAGPDGGTLSPCDTLVLQSCGAVDGAGDCASSGACEAAVLTRTYEPGRCSEKTLDTQRFPACHSTENDPERALGAVADAPPTACDDLVARTCGAGDACHAEDACVLSRDLATLADVAACQQALADTTSFPACLSTGDGDGTVGNGTRGDAGP